MTRVQGDIKTVTGSAVVVTEVWVRAARHRPVDGGWMTTINSRSVVERGRVEVDLEPGVAVMVAVSGGMPGESVELVVPDSGTASLDACIRAAEATDGLGRDGLDELRRDFGVWVDEVRASMSAAAGSAEAAGRSASAAGESAGAASSSADTARGHAEQAGVKASDAGRAADRAEGARSEARTAWDGAKEARDAAEGHASTAEGHANRAGESANSAEESAGRAQSSAQRASEIADSTSWDGDRLTVNGQQSPHLTGPQGATGPQGPPGTVDGLDLEKYVLKTDLPSFDDVVRAGQDGVRMGKHFTLEHDGSGTFSTSLFLKNGQHEYEFFTNRAGKFGAWDNAHTVGLFQADRNTFEHQTAVDLRGNQLRGLPAPSGDNHAATKAYVDSRVQNVDTSSLATKQELNSTNSRVRSLEGQVGVMESKIPTIEVVDAVPSNPRTGTLYLVRER